MKRNYQIELDAVLQSLPQGQLPKLLLHSCCAPCSTYVLEYLSRYFQITVLYYNPNIYPESEFTFRAEEQQRIAAQMQLENPVSVVVLPYEPQEFYDAVRGVEQIPEGGERCFRCYALRLERTAEYAKSHGFDYFTTTLSISPHKNAQKLNEIAEEIARTSGLKTLPCDFKKRGGFQRSTELSREFGIYRQDYCGCVYSLQEKEQKNKQATDNRRA